VSPEALLSWLFPCVVRALTIRRPASIYAFDVVTTSNAVFLANRRLFAFAIKGAPMDVKCDIDGNVYAGCGDGLEIWNPAGTLLGIVEVPSTSGYPHTSVKI
jgi:gluconolactonase